ncbi:hypothetical protein DS2_07938 [Catenovulum agarivorans DS-2]|uniref:Uncharacterized protein n=1 Tax=Catenovulum agarivorans DS-2 TaxID=1328313 RepID=W7QN60_9ALTE|nr:DsrH/TusB family sulfur metabolism protein [Catenovulum agarivorans]EWH10387.1 hypothetical protein DS2_07938 [Catenovulum agarivorans DS-2]
MPSPLLTVKQVLRVPELVKLASLNNYTILFQQDGCYNLLKAEMSQLKQCYILADDAQARGLSVYQQANQTWLSTLEWVELTVKHQPIIQYNLNSE